MKKYILTAVVCMIAGVAAAQNVKPENVKTPQRVKLTQAQLSKKSATPAPVTKKTVKMQKANTANTTVAPAPTAK